MTAQLIDGIGIAAGSAPTGSRGSGGCSAGASTPGLAVIIVGENPASQVYVRNKVRACAEVGIHSEEHRFCRRRDDRGSARADRGAERRPADPRHPRAAAAAAAHRRAARARVDRRREGRRRLPPRTTSAGWRRQDRLPAVHALRRDAAARVRATSRSPARTWSWSARSNIVGKPMALMLHAAGRHRHRLPQPARATSRRSRSSADILVVAVGKPQLDHGRHGEARRGGDRRRHQPPAERHSSSATSISTACAEGVGITPVPGGVGPMTVDDAARQHHPVRRARPRARADRWGDRGLGRVLAAL